MMKDIYSSLLALAGSFLSGVLLTKFSIFLSRKYRILAHPDQRSSHETPTPSIGGVGIGVPVVVFLVGAFIIGKHNLNFFAAALGGGLLAFITGLIDDLFGMKVAVKFVLQITCAVAAVGFGWSIPEITFPFLGTLQLGSSLAAAATILWIVFIMNAFNFMDGMDGQAGVFALIVLLCMVLTVFMGGRVSFVSLLLLVILGATAGFLVFNIAPAKTFLGDCGSQFIGYILAFLSVYIVAEHRGVVSITAFNILVLPFVYDVIYTIICRIRRRENIFRPHRSHLYQRLMIVGMSHGRVLKRTCATFLMCALAFLVYVLSDSDVLQLISLIFAVCVMIFYTLYVIWEECTT